MTNNADLTTIANYTISKLDLPPAVTPTITAVVPEAVANPTYVDLNLNIPMTNNGQYTVTLVLPGLIPVGTINVLGSVYSNKLDIPPYNKVQFLGFGSVVQQSLYKDNLINTPILEGTSSISFAPTKATLLWYPLGATGSLLFSAKTAGTSGNSIVVWLKNPGLPNQPLHITNVNNNITISLCTNSASTVVTRLQEVVTLLTGYGTAVDVIAAGNINSAVVPMPTASALSGGAKLDTSTTIKIIQNDIAVPTLGSLDPDDVSIT
jgi:hypothetical protein